MKFVFLGTGGGRFTMARQLRRTAGFVVRSGGTTVHVDPGPGALVYLNKMVCAPQSLNAILVSHAHPDHAHDVAVLVEGMADGGRRKRGILIGSKYVIHGGESFLPAAGPYHANMLERLIAAEPGGNYRVGDLNVTATPTWHDEPTGVGFIFDDGSVRVAYLSDTGYTEELGDALQSARPDVLIFNLINDSDDRVPHTTMDTVRSVLSTVRPRLVLLQHFGARIITRKREEHLARVVEKEFGVPARALKDGDVVDVREVLRERRIDEYF